MVCGGRMPHEKVELEGILFTASDFPVNIWGFDSEPRKLHAGCQER